MQVEGRGRWAALAVKPRGQLLCCLWSRLTGSNRGCELYSRSCGDAERWRGAPSEAKLQWREPMRRSAGWDFSRETEIPSSPWRQRGWGHNVSMLANISFLGWSVDGQLGLGAVREASDWLCERLRLPIIWAKCRPRPALGFGLQVYIICTFWMCTAACTLWDETNVGTEEQFVKPSVTTFCKWLLVSLHLTAVLQLETDGG